MQRRDALTEAYNQGLDLVEINPTAKPPVVKIMDFNKFLYTEKQKAKEAKAKQTKITVKEIQFFPNIADHDLNIKLNKAKEFLADGDKVKIMIKFRGREITKQDQGQLLVSKTLTILEGHCVVEKPANLDGRNMIMIVGPIKDVDKTKETTESN